MQIVNVSLDGMLSTLGFLMCLCLVECHPPCLSHRTRCLGPRLAPEALNENGMVEDNILVSPGTALR